ncbi:glycosyltransferase family 4 protein [Demequina zhanjiangensis]|uniref:D-inositol 3-phosphate glycosyltransferase n=1 Tax=Demequina zhanjiangensis TaxID=3051659 RepID=A0ABT8G0V2_9MICO|nr:glycosyltransferase family 4 protein [Demequina sp. SYSU T00b26]MDN4472761.1 glycosyltransferase family 4 protein [Demequina sp. SYSU T00b26]
MRIGIVCPYSLDRPGGVQLHVMDLAQALLARGHFVSVLAPAAPNTPVPGYVMSTGRSIPIPYNGSTARLSFGLLTASRVRKWLREGDFDVVHLHEPGAPSISVIAMWARLGPTVATFHTSNDDSALMRIGKPFIKPGYEELDARIAVSPSAARTVFEHLRVEATHIIPNGVDTSTYVAAVAREQWRGTPEAPTVGILGRMDEPRKGLDDFLAAIPGVRDKVPGTRFLVAGRYSDRTAERIRKAGAVSIGPLDEKDKERFMSSLDVYVAPNTGGESFGIVLVEAMAAGAAVVASDLTAFRDVGTAADGNLAVRLFPVGESDGLAKELTRLLEDPALRRRLSRRGQELAGTFDWLQVVPRVEETYLDAIRLDAELSPQPVKEEESA